MENAYFILTRARLLVWPRSVTLTKIDWFVGVFDGSRTTTCDSPSTPGTFPTNSTCNGYTFTFAS